MLHHCVTTEAIALPQQLGATVDGKKRYVPLPPLPAAAAGMSPGIALAARIAVLCSPACH